MSKTIWILNHYAGNMFLVHGGRHYYMAKYLKKQGFDPVVFCSNYDHFTHNKCVDSNKLWEERTDSDTNVQYVFIKTREYHDNGSQRVLNMLDYYRGVLKTAKQYAAYKGRPDIIYASSVHPLALVAGIKMAKAFGVKCMSEVRDLWPESIVAYSTKWTKSNPIIKLLYSGEKWIYKKSDSIIMTWPGGVDYIKEQGWQKTIPESKVFHISNGVDMESYTENIKNNPYIDPILESSDYKSFVYTGSVRKVNNLGMLVKAAEILKKKEISEAKIIVFGDGDELDRLKEEAQNKKLDNIVFRGRVSKQYVPSILTQCYVSILHNSSTVLDKYGQSQNKFFEYLAAGKPILMTYSVGHSIIQKHKCGIELSTQSAESIAEAIIALCNLSDIEYRDYCNNAKSCSQKFDYKELCNQLIKIIDQCTSQGEN